MTRYYLYCRAEPEPGELGGVRAWFYGEKLSARDVRGRPIHLAEDQARWMGPRLAAHWRCEVKMLAPDEAGEGGHRYIESACWRYNCQTGAVETIQEWGDDGHGQEARCDGVSSMSPGSGSASGGA